MTTSGEITLEHLLNFGIANRPERFIAPTKTVTRGLGLEDASEIQAPPLYQRQRVGGTDYAKPYQQQEQQSIIQSLHRTTITNPDGTTITLSQLDELEQAVVEEGAEDDTSEGGLDDYSARFATATPAHYNSDLVITSHCRKIIHLINVHNVVIIQGATGCGKTTQVPQYILDDALARGKPCNIIVTQPRRIAARSVAQRVCQERQWQLGTVVAYQVGLDSTVTPNTKITYATTGVLLQKLISRKRMDMYTHVIIDEIHERDQDTDMVLLMVRKFLRTNSREVKVILMSATFDTDIFANYFASPVGSRLVPASVFTILGKGKNVAEYYLEELRTLGELPIIDFATPAIQQESFILAVKLIKMFDRIDVLEPPRDQTEETPSIRGSVLVFLPGYEEISIMQEHLHKCSGQYKWCILPLHSTVTSEEQAKVFVRPPKGYRKIILSTNIAESSITVTDIKYVVDFCLTRSLVTDPDTRYSRLQLEWASKANCKQRKGRAGRISEGRVYRMVPCRFYDNLPDYGIPEIQRCPLEQVVLKVKRLDIGEPKATLALALNPPDLLDIERAVLALKEVGALALTLNGSITPYDGDLTYVGQIMSELPLDVKISRLLILGFVFDCLRDCVIIAASLSLQSFFAKPFGAFLEAYKSRLAWADGSFSDSLAFLNAYNVWQGHKLRGSFQRPGGQSERDWGMQSFVQIRRIKEVEKLVTELTDRLKNCGIEAPQNLHHRRAPAETLLILRIVICGAFYPNYFVPGSLDEMEINKFLSSKDPLTTVMVNGLPPNQGILYTETLKELFAGCSGNMHIDVEDSKAYVQFARNPNSQISGVVPGVYLAVKMRQLRLPLEIQLYPGEEAHRKLEELRRIRDAKCGRDKLLRSNRISIVSSDQTIPPAVMPPMNQLTLEIYITEMADCGHFWARHKDPEGKTQRNLGYMSQTINMCQNLPPVTGRLKPNSVVLAPYEESPKQYTYHRAVVEDVSLSGVTIFYVDFGGKREIRDTSVLRGVPPKMTAIYSTPAQVFECMLCEVRPSVLTSFDGKWSKEAREWFHKAVSGKNFVARVYSVVQDIVHLELVEPTRTGQEISINTKLVELGFAEPMQESLLSRQNNELRTKCEMLSQREVQLLAEQMNKDFIALPLSDERRFKSYGPGSQKVRLHGPFSPLEVTYSGCTRISSFRQISMERDSVNSVSLDAEPQDQQRRFLVACSVGVNSVGTAVMLRNTTLMPNIRGLPALISLLFAPKVEFRTDKERKRYTGALCGLGCDPQTREPLNPDHDMELTFNVGLNHHDITEINSVRMGINLILANEDDMRNMRSSLWKCQKKICSTLLLLLKRQRQWMEPVPYMKPYQWQTVSEEFLMTPDLNDTADCPHVLPLHRPVNLSEDDMLETLREHLAELFSHASRSQHVEINKCQPCGVVTSTPRELLLHLNSYEHTKKVNEIFQQNHPQSN